MSDKFTAIRVSTPDGVVGEVKFNHFGEEREINLNDSEKEVASYAIQSLLDAGMDESLIRIVRKSDSYATIVAHGEYDYDLMRFKFTPRAHWVSVPVTNGQEKEFADDLRFAAQKNKKQLMWKANIDSPEDAGKFAEFMMHAFEFVSSKNPGAFA